VADVHTHELCLDAKDNLYGEHLWYEGDATKKWGHRVWRLKPDGTVSDVIPAREGFLKDYSFVRDRAGNMYWADRGKKTVIKKRSPDGKIATHQARRRERESPRASDSAALGMRRTQIQKPRQERQKSTSV